jgi:hypothetical protein
MGIPQDICGFSEKYCQNFFIKSKHFCNNTAYLQGCVVQENVFSNINTSNYCSICLAVPLLAVQYVGR